MADTAARNSRAGGLGVMKRSTASDGSVGDTCFSVARPAGTSAWKGTVSVLLYQGRGLMS